MATLPDNVAVSTLRISGSDILDQKVVQPHRAGIETLVKEEKPQELLIVIGHLTFSFVIFLTMLSLRL
jgi:hypothetical protein